MRFKGRMELEHGLRQVDIVPLINVLFLLLIFFMLTANFATQPAIKVDLPKAVTSEAVRGLNIEIIISAANITSIDGKAVSVQELSSLLRQAARRDQAVIIKADRHASLDRVVQVLDICRNSGIRQSNIATNQE